MFLINQLASCCVWSPPVRVNACLLALALFALLASAAPVHAGVVINELMVNAEGDDANAEFIELHNPGEEAVELSGWAFTEGVNFTFRPGTTLPADGYLVVCRNELFIRAEYGLGEGALTVGNYAPSNLSNGGETLTLRNQAGEVVDQVGFELAPPWPVLADGLGASMELIHPLLDNQVGAFWQASESPTPGAVNAQRMEAAPPRFQSIEREPRAPQSGDAVRIAVRFHPDDALHSVLLTYRVDEGDEVQLDMTSTNGNRFEATLPAQNEGARVAYRIMALSQDGPSLTAPFAGSFDHFVYHVDDSPAAPGSVLINEIMYDNPLAFEEDLEWIELYNPTDQTIDLADWQVRDENQANRWRLPAGAEIAAGGYLLLAREADPIWLAPVVEGMPFSLSDTGDEVRLFDANGRLITHVRYDNDSEWPEGANGEGGSLELVQTQRPNHAPNNWAVAPFGGTPGEPNRNAIQDVDYRDYEVVINEIFYHPPDEEYDDNIELEYIELLNRGDRAVDLSGWRFSNGVEFTFGTGVSIAANDYLLVCRNIERYANIPNRTGNFLLRFSNAGEPVALTSDRGIVIDYVNYDDRFPWPVLPDGEGHSLELKAPFGDNSQAQMWGSGQPMSPGGPNPGAQGNPPPRITDVQHHPAVPIAVEQAERTEQRYVVRSGMRWRYHPGESDPGRDWNQPDFDDGEWAIGPSGIGYGDGDDRTVLEDMRYNYVSAYMRHKFSYDPSGEIDRLILTMDYDDSFIAYLNGVEVARANVSGNPPAYDQSADGNHEAGVAETFDISDHIGLLREGANLLAIEGHNVSLTSSDFTLNPELVIETIIPPSEEDPSSVRIEAEVADADGLVEVKLHAQRLHAPAGLGLQRDPWQTFLMNDAGEEGDRVAGDGVFGFRLSDQVQLQPGDVWRYHITAIDQRGGQAAVPRQEGFTRHFGFYVEDAAGSEGIRTVRILAEREVLGALVQNPDSDEERRAVVVIDGAVYDIFYGDGGVRFRGPDNVDKRSWRIRFPRGQRWNGLSAIDLNAGHHDAPLVQGEAGTLAYLAYELYDEAGLPVPHHEPVRVTLNGEYHGLYHLVARYDQRFADQAQLPRGTQIYQAGVSNRESRLTPEEGFEQYALKYESHTGRNQDIQPLIEWIEGLHAGEETEAFLREHVDVPAYLDYLAITALLSHIDSVDNNYYLVAPPNGLWRLLPRELSQTWGNTLFTVNFPLEAEVSLLDGAEGGILGENALRKGFLAVPEFRRQYAERLRAMAETLFAEDAFAQQVTQYFDRMQTALDENRDRWGRQGLINELPDRLVQYIEARRAFILQSELLPEMQRPAAPVALAPADGAVLDGRAATLRLEPPAGEMPAAVEWRLQISGQPFWNPLWQMRQSNPSELAAPVPATVLSPDSEYRWQARWRFLGDSGQTGLWSDWSDAAAFSTGDILPVPNVVALTAEALDGSVRLTWQTPRADDLLRVDIFDNQGRLIESTPIEDSRVRIRGLQNGVTYQFIVRTVSVDRRTSTGVPVEIEPRAPQSTQGALAYFRFENNADDQIAERDFAELLGSSRIDAPGGLDPVPATNQDNQASLWIGGEAGNGFVFEAGAIDSLATQMTVECFAMRSQLSDAPQVLVDRYDQAQALERGVWRLAANLSEPGSLDFLLNDADSMLGWPGRLHIATEQPIAWSEGVFHHVAAVIDLNETSFLRKVRLFIDGEPQTVRLVHEDGVSDYERLPANTGQPVTIGARTAGDSTVEAWHGRIDELRISGSALEPAAFLHPPADPVQVDHWSLF